MKKIDSFINRYPISKTLRFSLIPIGKTEENFIKADILKEDLVRDKEYKKVKKLIDKYHKHFLDSVLSTVVLDEIGDYSELYYLPGKTSKENEQMDVLEEKMRKTIASAFSKDKRFKSLFGREIIEEILPEFLTDEEEKKSVEAFCKFTTYFRGFNENRKNIYTHEAKSTAASYRCVNDNLPKFLDNAASFAKISEVLSNDDVCALDDLTMNLCGVYLKDIFTCDYFNFVLSQSGIDKYNSIIGGHTNSDGTKEKGLNEYINLYNQQIAGNDRTKKLPFMKELYKQILSDKDSISFIPESFENDDDLIDSVKNFFSESLCKKIASLDEIFQHFEDYNPDGIFVKSGISVTNISNAVFGDWNAVAKSWKLEYEKAHPLKDIKKSEKYYDTLQKEYNAVKSFSVSELQQLGEEYKTEECIGNIELYLKDTTKEKAANITAKFEAAHSLLNCKYSETYDKKLAKNDQAINTIKELLDSVKALESTLKALLGTGKEANKDEVFYGQLLPVYEEISTIDKLYDKVRNYITKKPYSNDKIKLNFENPQFLGGWDKNKERDYRTVILRKDGFYYLAIMDKSNNKAFVDPPVAENEKCYEKLEYKLLPGPNKMLPKVFFADSNFNLFNPSQEILNIRKNETFKKGNSFNLKDCHTFIDFFKNSIKMHPDWSKFGFQFSPTESYGDISEFYNEVKEQGYSINFRYIPKNYINELVDSGQLYLFKIYNKDFSNYSHGNPNLHTLYFKMLFDEENLKDVVYKLNGEAEMFYRMASIKDNEKIVHHANEPIDNKNPDNPKKQSVFEYDITKDKRYTKRQFSLHLPITLNFKAVGQTYLNNDVRLAIKNSDENYVIGIDRGERNLLYICVINSKGEIVEQKSLNTIGNRVDYHKLLDQKEKGRDEARKNWGTIENIKELKEGYLSQTIHEITKLMLKYDAIIAMEDLNFGFKNGRFKVEKQVYQKFENMLITKLNYLVSKNASVNENGGLLNAYQLTNEAKGINKAKQDGFIFYVPAYLTSKIDPVTGFVNLLYPRYTSVAESRRFIENIDAVRYNEKENLFEFDIDYSKFPKTNATFRKKWTICTNGERIISFRNKEKNNSWDNKTIKLTDEFISLFEKYGVDWKYGNIREALLSQSEKDFYEKFFNLFAATLQMRNSETGNTDVDYIVSPIRDKNGKFYDSRNYNGENSILPENADANGAYNIARKALWAVSVLKATENDKLPKANLAITNAQWLEFVQK